MFPNERPPSFSTSTHTVDRSSTEQGSSSTVFHKEVGDANVFVRSIKAGLVGLGVLSQWSCHWVISKEKSPARSRNDNHSKAHHPRVKVFTQTLWHSHALFTLCLRDREGSGMFTILAHRLHFHTCPMYSVTSTLQIISFENKSELSTDNLKWHQILLPSKSLWKKQIEYRLPCLHTTTIPNGLATLVAWARQENRCRLYLSFNYLKKNLLSIHK